MTEKKPEPGKTWLTVELDTQDVVDLADVDIWDLDIVDEVKGEEPETPREKGIRRLGEARRRFDDAAFGFGPAHPMDGSGPRALRDGCSLLSEALTLLGGDL